MKTLEASSNGSNLDQQSVDVSDEVMVPFEEDIASTDAPELEAISQPSALRKLGGLGLKVAKGETVGTIVDVGTIMMGVPLPARELAGSAIDYKIYGDDGAETNEKEVPKTKRIRRAIGTIALYSASGIVAQKYGSEVAGAMRDSLNDGTMGMYVTPLVAKLGAVFGVNAAMKKMSR